MPALGAAPARRARCVAAEFPGALAPCATTWHTTVSPSSPSSSATRRERPAPARGVSRAAVEALDEAAKATVATVLLARCPRAPCRLAREFPPLRAAVSVSLVDETARPTPLRLHDGLAETVPVLSARWRSATCRADQEPVADVLPHRAGARPSGERGRCSARFIGVLGSGVLLRQAARQLVGSSRARLIPRSHRVRGHVGGRARHDAVASEGRDVTRTRCVATRGRLAPARYGARDVRQGTQVTACRLECVLAWEAEGREEH